MKVGIMLKAAPAAGGRVIEQEGTVALNFSNASNAAKTTLKAIPTETRGIPFKLSFGAGL